MYQSEITNEITKRIVDNFNPERVILFGSRARDDAHANSDYDVLIIAPSNVPQWKRSIPVYLKLKGLITGVGIDVVWWTEDEIAYWAGVKTHFINRILNDGKVMYAKST